MIAKTLNIVKVDHQLYGDPLSNEIEPQVNGTFNNLDIPLRFEFNGSWEIQHSCSRCTGSVSFGMEYIKEKNAYPVRLYEEMKYLCSKYYKESFLIHLSKVFTGVEVIRLGDQSYLVSQNTFEIDYPVSSSIEPVYYCCTKCQADYLALVSMAGPILPDKDIPSGKKGLISVDEIVFIEIEGGRRWSDAIQDNLSSN